VLTSSLGDERLAKTRLYIYLTPPFQVVRKLLPVSPDIAQFSDPVIAEYLTHSPHHQLIEPCGGHVESSPPW
jgi:hypothetical protein